MSAKVVARSLREDARCGYFRMRKPPAHQVGRFDWRDNDCVAGAHCFKCGVLQLALLVIQPCRLNIGSYFFESGYAGRLGRIDQDQMPAVTGTDWPLPRPGLE